MLRAMVDRGFERPPGQRECIPQAILATEVPSQSQSGMGKTAVFVLACLPQLDDLEPLKTLVMCPMREFAYQIKHEFYQFAKCCQDVKVCPTSSSALRAGSWAQCGRRIASSTIQRSVYWMSVTSAWTGWT